MQLKQFGKHFFNQETAPELWPLRDRALQGTTWCSRPDMRGSETTKPPGGDGVCLTASQFRRFRQQGTTVLGAEPTLLIRRDNDARSLI